MKDTAMELTGVPSSKSCGGDSNEVEPQNPTSMMISKQQEHYWEGTSACGAIINGIPPPPDTLSMKEERKQTVVVVGIFSGVAGLLLVGPVVGVVAGFTCAVVAKKKWKKKEKKALAKYQKELAEMLCPPMQRY
ncbi:expressed unknown protein [Seminavis robusta]|uniref:Uncharacterized protein n=1 Tax=Seminavis robusta TaxID=568900 RepID=A0A9N8EPU2_9STRA|nr:expressed unknown protein [Seminavis robusta]|eukprot:Sro1363_g266340.1 n/a (134) ;mRNA; r:9452-9853